MNCFPLQSVSHVLLQMLVMAMTAKLAIGQAAGLSILHLQESLALKTMVCNHDLRMNSDIIKTIIFAYA